VQRSGLKVQRSDLKVQRSDRTAGLSDRRTDLRTIAPSHWPSHPSPPRTVAPLQVAITLA